MSKKEDTKLLKIQTYVLKVHIHCDGCNKKVKKLLRKIDGVYTTSIDAEQGKVTVSGTVDPAILIKKLAKAGKHAELLLPKGGNPVNNTKPQQKENGKPQKGGSGGVGGGGPAAKDPKGQLQLELLQQLKGFKDLKLPPLKDQKNVKFALPLEDGSDFDDELDGDYDDEDDEGFDDIDGFEDDLDADPKRTKQHDFDFLLKGGSAAAGGGGKKGGGGGVEIPVHFTGGGKKGDKGGGGGKDAKNGGKNNKGGNNGNPNKMMGQPAVQGLPAAAPTGMLPPAAAANAYQQQQYMAAMMQQRAMMNGEYGGYPQMGYMRVAPAPPPPPGEPIGNYYYSDENTSWCSIM